MSKQLEVLGNNIASLRKARGLTQRELALEMGVSGGLVSQWEGGKVDIPFTVLWAIKETFAVSLNELTGPEPPVPPPARKPTAAEVAMFVIGNLQVSETQRAVVRFALEADESQLADILRIIQPLQRTN